MNKMAIDEALGRLNLERGDLVQREIAKMQMRIEEINQRLDVLTDHDLSVRERMEDMPYEERREYEKILYQDRQEVNSLKNERWELYHESRKLEEK